MTSLAAQMHASYLRTARPVSYAQAMHERWRRAVRYAGEEQPPANLPAPQPAPLKAPPFHSRLQKALEGLGTKPLPSLAVKNRVKKFGVPDEEWHATKMDAALAGKPQVHPAELLEHFHANKVMPGEVWKGASSEAQSRAALQEHQRRMIDKYGGLSEFWSKGAPAEIAEWNRLTNGAPLAPVDPTKHEGYQTPGGKNYREMLLTAPHSGATKDALRLRDELTQRSRQMDDDIDRSNAGEEEFPDDYFDKERAEISQLHGELQALDKQSIQHDYRSPHWDEPNVLAHVRMNEREEPNYGSHDVEAIAKKLRDRGYSLLFPKDSVDSGVQRGVISPAEAAIYRHAEGLAGDKTGAADKGLHVEEVQSDWAQEGRKHGFKSGPLPEPQWEDKQRGSRKYVSAQLGDVHVNIVQLDNGKFHLGSNWSELGGEEFDTLDQAKKYAESKVSRDDTRVPDMNYKESWPTLALKRALYHAAENGHNRLTVNSGEQIQKLVGGDLIGQAGFYGTGLDAKTLGDLALKRAHNRSDEERTHQDRQLLAGAMTPEEAGEKIRQQRDVPNILAKLGKPYGVKPEPHLLNNENAEKIANLESANKRAIEFGQKLRSEISDRITNSPNHDPANLAVMQEIIDSAPAFVKGYADKYGIPVEKLQQYRDNYSTFKERSRELRELKSRHAPVNTTSLPITPAMRQAILAQGFPHMEEGGESPGGPTVLQPGEVVHPAQANPWAVPMIPGADPHKDSVIATLHRGDVVEPVHQGYAADVATRVQAAADKTHTEPSDAQKEAGNFKKGKVQVRGLTIAIEVPKGATRSGKSKDGKEWSIKLPHSYGYFFGYKGKDKEHLDVFVGPDPESEIVFVVDQVKPDSGRFDESKVLVGWTNLKDAKQGYLDCYSPGWKGLGSVASFTWTQFRKWLDKGDLTKPAAPQMDYERKPYSKDDWVQVQAVYDLADGQQKVAVSALMSEMREQERAELVRPDVKRRLRSILYAEDAAHHWHGQGGQFAPKGESDAAAPATEEAAPAQPSSSAPAAQKGPAPTLRQQVLGRMADVGKKVLSGAMKVEHGAAHVFEHGHEHLPKALQPVAVGVRATLFGTYRAANAAVQAVARERGCTPEQAQQVATAMTMADSVLGGKLLPMAVGFAGGGPLGALAAGFVPVGSIGYLSYSLAPLAWSKFRSAAASVAKVLGRKQPEKYADDTHVSEAGAHLIHDLVDRALRHGERFDDWLACFGVALDETEGDLHASLEAADEALLGMEPADDDADLVDALEPEEEFRWEREGAPDQGEAEKEGYGVERYGIFDEPTNQSVPKVGHAPEDTSIFEHINKNAPHVLETLRTVFHHHDPFRQWMRNRYAASDMPASPKHYESLNRFATDNYYIQPHRAMLADNPTLQEALTRHGRYTTRKNTITEMPSSAGYETDPNLRTYGIKSYSPHQMQDNSWLWTKNYFDPSVLRKTLPELEAMGYGGLGHDDGSIQASHMTPREKAAAGIVPIEDNLHQLHQEAPWYPYLNQHIAALGNDPDPGAVHDLLEQHRGETQKVRTIPVQDPEQLQRLVVKHQQTQQGHPELTVKKAKSEMPVPPIPGDYVRFVNAKTGKPIMLGEVQGRKDQGHYQPGTPEALPQDETHYHLPISLLPSLNPHVHIVNGGGERIKERDKLSLPFDSLGYGAEKRPDEPNPYHRPANNIEEPVMPRPISYAAQMHQSYIASNVPPGGLPPSPAPVRGGDFRLPNVPQTPMVKPGGHDINPAVTKVPPSPLPGTKPVQTFPTNTPPAQAAQTPGLQQKLDAVQAIRQAHALLAAQGLNPERHHQTIADLLNHSGKYDPVHGAETGNYEYKTSPEAAYEAARAYFAGSGQDYDKRYLRDLEAARGNPDKLQNLLSETLPAAMFHQHFRKLGNYNSSLESALKGNPQLQAMLGGARGVTPAQVEGALRSMPGYQPPPSQYQRINYARAMHRSWQEARR